MNNNAIVVKNMSKDFKRVFDKPQTLKEKLVFWTKEKPELFHVLKDINIEIKKGDTVALVGSNGSGKSTLLKLMTKILYPTKGSVITSGKLTSLLELGAGFHPDFTGRENIYFNASIFGLSRQEIDDRLNEIIEFSELGSFIDNPVRTYSSGMYMRLAFSVAINVDAEILLIDEILAVGDQRFQNKCFAKLEELRDSDKTIVIVSHGLDTIERLCNRAIWIYKGEVKKDGKPSEVISSYLEQTIIDHGEDIDGSNNTNNDAIIQVDEPKAGQKYTDKIENITVRGWELSSVSENTVKVYMDGKEVAIAKRRVREDVNKAYEDQYGGVFKNKECGFYEFIEVPKQAGMHVVGTKVFNAHNELISEFYVPIKIESKEGRNDEK